MTVWDFTEPGWRSKWRRVADQPPRREYDDLYELGGYTGHRYRFTTPRIIHPLDEHLAKHAEYLGILLHALDQQRPDGADLLNASGTATLVEYRDEALCLLMESYRRGADAAGCAHLNRCLDDVEAWLDIAQAAQRLVGDYTNSKCSQCAHWSMSPFVTDTANGYCAKRDHERTGDSVACQDFEK